MDREKSRGWRMAASVDEKDALKTYLSLMEELKVRFAVVNEAAANRAGLPPQIAREICYLQFRMTCEVIALGCLVAHGTHNWPSKLHGRYQAARLIKSMQEL